MKLLGCKIDTKHELKTAFKHPVDKYDMAVFLDPVHMFKLVRNHWESKKVILDSNNNKIDWNLLCQLNKLQEDEGLHFANKITRRHIMFRNNIMKVKLASQVLSTSVATALKFCRENAKLTTFKNSEPTEHFVRNMNNLFDVFNSRNMKQFDYKQPLYSRNKDFIFTFLNLMKTYIRELKIKQATKRKIDKEGKKVQVILQSFKPILECSCKTGFLGILIGIESLQSLYISLVEEDNMLVFIPSYKYCQDHLELLFGMMRMHGGHNNNPNAKQFKGIYRKVLCNLEIKASDNGNCIPLESIGVLNCSSSIKVINGSAQLQKLQEEQLCNDSITITETCSSVVKFLSTELPDLHDLNRYIVGYISGSVAHYLLKVIKCEFCIDALQASDVLWFHKLISLKNRGGLCFPSQSLYDVCCICEAHVRRIVHEDFVVTSNTQRLAIVLQIFKKILGNCGIFIFEENHVNDQIHKNSLIRAVIEKYLDIRLHHVSKCKTLKIIPDSKRQYYNKLTQQKGT
ncbi:unnamed protein product [Euphydryas editha]|uniref:THAP domain-containing protein 9 n=1 Tax=Euphydryas editha TaxID=104508 RepID=A0AAU9TQC3_EUPED|nr:unnamed protein product [Euphydryas editha]